MGARIQEELELQNKSQAWLSAKSGVDAGTLSALIKRDSERSVYALEIAVALGLNVSWLMSGKGAKYPSEPAPADEESWRAYSDANNNGAASPISNGDDLEGDSALATEQLKNDPNYVYVPVFAATAGMGNGRENHREELSGQHFYAKSWLLQERLDPRQLCRIKGDGDSMLPTIADGDTLLLNQAETKVISGKVFAFRVGDEIRVKRLFRQLDGRVRVVSDNPDKTLYPDEFLSIDDAPEIIGRIRERSGKNGL